MFTRKTLTTFSLLMAFAVLPVFATAQKKSNNQTVKVGKYAVELRIPSEGVFGDEETDLEFRLTDASQDDPVQGAPPVVRAQIAARVTMPAMPAMPAQNPKTHSEGVAGDYGVVIFFPHGGDYQLNLTITPPGDKPFTAEFKVAVNDASATRKPRPKPYTLEVQTNPPRLSGATTAHLTIRVRNRDTKQVVTDFDLTHERKMHFVIVSKDLSYFAHEHPDFAPDGNFTLNASFPGGGEYHLFADCAPHDAGAQVLMQSLSIEGPGSGPTPLKPGVTTDTVEGMKFALQTSLSDLKARHMLPVTFTVRDARTDAPITDLEPYLGAMAHLILIHQDAATFVHCHPDETDPKNGHNGSLTFSARFPKPGIYKGWVQVQRGGKVVTAAFVVEVKG